MKKYISTRVVNANSKKEVIRKTQDNNFLEHDDLCDAINSESDLLKQLSTRETDMFPNGFVSWQETHFEIVSAIAKNPEDAHNKVNDIEATKGTGGLYEFAEELTNKFELKNKGRVWDIN